MTRKLWMSGVFLVFGLGAATVRADDKSDKDKLQGSWESVKVTIDGKEVPADGKKTVMVFEGNKMVAKNKGAAGGDSTFVLDETKKPKTITFDESDKKEGMKCIYKLEDDTLTIAMTKPGSPAPASFDAKGAFVLTLKRVKAK